MIFNIYATDTFKLAMIVFMKEIIFECETGNVTFCGTNLLL